MDAGPLSTSKIVGWQGTGTSHDTVRGSEPSRALLWEVGVEDACTLVAWPVISLVRKEMMFCGSGHKTGGSKECWDPGGDLTFF